MSNGVVRVIIIITVKIQRYYLHYIFPETVTNGCDCITYRKFITLDYTLVTQNFSSLVPLTLVHLALLWNNFEVQDSRCH